MSDHAYKRDPQSDAGNCWCGAPERHVRHPHRFMRGWRTEPAGSETLCTCSRPLADAVHTPEVAEHLGDRE